MRAGPNRPEPKPVSLEVGTTAAAVLDLSTRCHDPRDVCSKLMQPLGGFLERIRAARVPIIFTVSAFTKGTPEGEVASPLKRQETEPVIYPDAFDKFHGGELQAFLSSKGVKELIVVGSVANISVLYTSTTAARVYGYEVILPVDGVNARTEYEQEYAFHQLTVLPRGIHQRIRFTTLSTIQFIQ